MQLPNNVYASRNLRTGKEIRFDPKNNDVRVTSSGQYFYAGYPDGRIDQMLIDGFRLVRSIRPSTKPVYKLHLSGDLTHLVAECNPPPWNGDTEYVVIDAASMKVISRIDYYWANKERFLPDVSLSKDGSRLAVSTNAYSYVDRGTQRNGVIHMFSTKTGRPVVKIQRKDSIYDSVISPDGRRVYAASMARGFRERSRVTTYDVESGETIGTFEPPPFGRLITDLWLDPTGTFIAGNQYPGGEGLLWRVVDRKLIGQIGAGAEVNGLSFSGDGQRLISSISPGMPPTIWDCNTGRALYVLEDPTPAKVTGVSTGIFANGDRDVIVINADGKVRIYRSVPWKDQPKAERKKGP